MHLCMVPEHLEEWWGYGAFFLVLAVAILWLVTRTTEIPFLGPHAGEVEGVGVLDLACTLAEVGVVAMLGVLAMRGLQTEGRIQIVVVLAASSLLFWHLLHLLAGSSSH
jgi:manganese oxidase